MSGPLSRRPFSVSEKTIRYTGAVGDRPVDPCFRPPEIAGTVDQEEMRQLELFAEHIIPAFR